MKFRIALIVGILVLGAGLALAQEQDAENCKDHPMFTRMKNFFISDCKSRFDAHVFYLTDGTEKTVEGQMTTVDYALREGSQQPSPLQIRRNFENAIKSLAGTILCLSDNGVCGKIVKSGREVWVDVQIYNDGNDYTLTVVEVSAMVQEVTASDMLTALNKDGYIALYINFDTGKSDIKPESLPVVEQIVHLLKDNPELKLGIEGHTDNVGTPAANKTLSEQRAKAVLAAVVRNGVAAARLTAVGWGQEKPIADNRSEDGRAKNRRVEIVKK